MRKRVVIGSMLGAVAVHVAFVACGGMSPGTGGPIGALMEAMSDGGVAHAAEDGGVACSCPVPPAPPAPPETTFSLRVDRGNGPEEPMQDYSRATVTVSPELLEDGTPGSNINVRVGFSLADRNQFSFICNVLARTDRTVVPETARCGITGVGDKVAGVSLSVLTDTSLELTIPSFSIRQNFQTITFSNFVLRASDPSAHYITPPRAYNP